MDLKAIRDHLSLARSALGPEHPLAARIKTVERSLTPGDTLWVGEAIRAQTDLLAISTELEHLPEIARPAVPGSPGIAEGSKTEVPPGVNEAIKQIADAIELL
jgi:hypothetical protein